MLSFLKRLFSTPKQSQPEIRQVIKEESNHLKQTRDSFNMKVERNHRGAELEKQGNIEEAIRLYEMNVDKGFDGNHPYDRLCAIYRKQGNITDEIRVLEKSN